MTRLERLEQLSNGGNLYGAAIPAQWALAMLRKAEQEWPCTCGVYDEKHNPLFPCNSCIWKAKLREEA